jgi:hypothetical protein
LVFLSAVGLVLKYILPKLINRLAYSLELMTLFAIAWAVFLGAVSELLFFFIDLGARLDWSAVGSQLGASALFSGFVLIGKPIIVLIIMGVMGYRRRTGFLAGLTVAQISEFSLIVAALGLSLGHITKEVVGLITLVGVVTIFVSSYLILYSGQLYRILARPLRVFERRNPYREAAKDVIGLPAPGWKGLPGRGHGTYRQSPGIGA